jgi:hypothetical protein
MAAYTGCLFLWRGKMENDEKTLPQAAQSEARLPEEPIAAEKSAGANCHDVLEHKPRSRKDKGRVHSTQHAILSRYPLEALVSLGENLRSLRRIELKFRVELKPSGIVGAVVFDRFFSSYLRCVLAARAEAAAFAPIDGPAGQPRRTASLKEAILPTLVLQDSGVSSEDLSPDLARQLVLIARYDRHFAREMYRALAFLLVLRSSGQAGLEQFAEHMLGLQKESSGGS